MDIKIVGFIVCYNEIDIIADTLQFYERAGVPIVVIDNGSTDGTSDVVRSYSPHAVREHVYHPTAEYDLRTMLDLALSVVEQQDPEWIMHIDADHLYEPGPKFLTYREHVEDAERLGCNVVDFDEYVFFSTDLDPSSEGSIYDRIKHYAFRPGKIPSDGSPALLQPRLYKYVPGMNISENGGHSITYPNREVIIHPDRGILRHYMFRSAEQGRRKLAERRSRYSMAGRARGWHTQYDKWCDDDSSFRREASALSHRKEGDSWNRNIIIAADGSISRQVGYGSDATIPKNPT